MRLSAHFTALAAAAALAGCGLAEAQECEGGTVKYFLDTLTVAKPRSDADLTGSCAESVPGELGLVTSGSSEHEVRVCSGGEWQALGGGGGGGGSFCAVETFDTAGDHTFIAPKGVTQVEYRIWGGGGGSGGPTASAAGSGGGGGYSAGVATVIPENSYTITVGDGGAVGTANSDEDGQAGGDSSAFGVVAHGGLPGGPNGKAGGGGWGHTESGRPGSSHKQLELQSEGAAGGLSFGGGVGGLFGDGSAEAAATDGMVPGGGGGGIHNVDQSVPPGGDECTTAVSDTACAVQITSGDAFNPSSTCYARYDDSFFVDSGGYIDVQQETADYDHSGCPNQGGPYKRSPYYNQLGATNDCASSGSLGGKSFMNLGRFRLKANNVIKYGGCSGAFRATCYFPDGTSWTSPKRQSGCVNYPTTTIPECEGAHAILTQSGGYCGSASFNDKKIHVTALPPLPVLDPVNFKGGNGARGKVEVLYGSCGAAHDFQRLANGTYSSCDTLMKAHPQHAMDGVYKLAAPGFDGTKDVFCHRDSDGTGWGLVWRSWRDVNSDTLTKAVSTREECGAGAVLPLWHPRVGGSTGDAQYDEGTCSSGDPSNTNNMVKLEDKFVNAMKSAHLGWNVKLQHHRWRGDEAAGSRWVKEGHALFHRDCVQDFSEYHEACPDPADLSTCPSESSKWCHRAWGGGRPNEDPEATKFWEQPSSTHGGTYVNYNWGSEISLRKFYKFREEGSYIMGPQAHGDYTYVAPTATGSSSTCHGCPEAINYCMFYDNRGCSGYMTHEVWVR